VAVSLEDIERRLALLEDERAIRDLLARYSFFADLQYQERYVNVFAEDGVFDLPSGRFEGRHSLFHDFVISRVMDRWPGRMQHWPVGPMLFTIDGDRAEAKGYSIVVGRNEGGENVVRSISANAWKFVRVDGEWLIQERLLRPCGSTEQAHVLGLDVE
jgi:hypothetical protein